MGRKEMSPMGSHLEVLVLSQGNYLRNFTRPCWRRKYQGLCPLEDISSPVPFLYLFLFPGRHEVSLLAPPIFLL